MAIEKMNAYAATKSRVALIKHILMNRYMIFPTIWYATPAKVQTSMRIRAV